MVPGWYKGKIKFTRKCFIKLIKGCRFHLIFLLCACLNGFAQQNHSLYLMHYLPESNLLNPAVPMPCKWYIGLPVLSSVHINYANSSFSYNTLFNRTSNGTYETDINHAVNSLHWRNYLGTEIHIQLLALGYRKGDYSFVFTVTEKDNLPITYPKEVILLAWRGNSQFEGKDANFKGTGIFFNHYREYAIGLSKYTGNGAYLGIKGKLLFGKLNISAKQTNIGLITNDTTYNLAFHGDINWRTSLPVVVDYSNGQINDIYYNDAVTPMNLLLNRKNPGFAIDAGIIYPINENLELSISVLDLGFIRWRSNLNLFTGNGNYVYPGPMGDNVQNQGFLGDLIDSITNSFNFNVTQEKYTTFLPPRLLAGVNYQVNNMFTVGASGDALFYRTKIMPSITLSGQFSPLQNIHLMASYNLQYYSIKSFGLGFVLGRNPIQFYMISDDVPAMIWPLSARNLNLRFGLNINFGCKIKQNIHGVSGGPGAGKGMLQGNCYWLEQSIHKHYQKQKRK
jgi:hypothetical protein